MIVACLIKEIQVSTELRKMADIQLVPQQTIDDLIMKKFNAPLRRKPDDDDPVRATDLRYTEMEKKPDPRLREMSAWPCLAVS